MKEYNNDLMVIEGGVSLSGSIISAIGNTVKIVLDLGRSLGSALRRGLSGKYCSL